MSADPANAGWMDEAPQSHAHNLIERRIEKKGLKPRVAASIIAVLWLGAIVAFGIAERLVDPDSFSSIWDGMWWATQTVTTVGYGDVVPVQTAGKLIAVVLMVGGLSLFAVVTGTITSAFVTRAQDESRRRRVDELEESLNDIAAEIKAVRGDLAAMAGKPAPGEGPTNPDA